MIQIFEAGWKERDWKWPLVPGKNGYVGSATYWAGNMDRMDFDPNVDDPDNILAFPVENINRLFAYPFIWLGKLANGTQIAPGNYT